MEHFDQKLVRALATCFSSGADDAAILCDCARMLGRDWRWLLPVTARFRKRFDAGTRPRAREVQRFLHQDPMVRRALRRLRGHLRIEQRLTIESRMQPAFDWSVPPILTPGALAEWLWIEPGELEWLADLRGLSRHYHYRVLLKRSGGVRLVESPKQRLKGIQRQILEWILDRIPTHPAAHGFVKGRSTRTFALPHVRQQAVLRMDLQNFFPALRRARIQSLFRTAGYPEAVADLLGGLCTTVTPGEVLADREERILHAMPHLPQGAPTSPALANLCAYRLDCRLSAFAEKLGAQYTRYADDLAFSGGREFARRVEDLPAYVGAIVAEEGFTANFRKTRVMRGGVRQRLAGLIVNEKLNIAQQDFDLLKAILTNCARHGAASQNREERSDFRAHLAGRVGYAESVHEGKGQKLRALFSAIKWD